MNRVGFSLILLVIPLYEKGYEYELLATKTIYANPPADGSSYDYTLIKVVSKMAKGNE